MGKGSEMRRRAGFYRPHARTKPTTGDLGPRDPGPHGKTLEQPRVRAALAAERLLAKWRKESE